MGVGFDPGFAHTGIAGVALVESVFHSTGIQFIHTQPDHTKKFRQSVDDLRRIITYYKAACQVIEVLKPVVIGVETYHIFESKEYEKLRDAGMNLVGGLYEKGKRMPDFEKFRQSPVSDEFVAKFDKLAFAADQFRVVRGRGAAAKTYGVFTAVALAGERYQIPVFGFTPSDLKMKATGKKGASKDDVANSLIQIVHGLQEKVEAKVAKTYREHAYDAAGHAWMAVREWLNR